MTYLESNECNLSRLLLHSTSGQGLSTSTEIQINPKIYRKKYKKIWYKIKQKKKGTYDNNTQLTINVNPFIQMRLLKKYTAIQVQFFLQKKKKKPYKCNPLSQPKIIQSFSFI